MKRTLAISTALFASLLLTATASTAGPSAHRTREGSGLLNALIFGDSDHHVPEQHPASQQPTVGAPATTASQIQSGRMKSAMYDGVWTNTHGRTLLIKQIHRTLYLSGSSNRAAWQAQCVSASQSARCIGNGISKTAGEFRYESNLNLDDLKLNSDWTRHYSNGQTRSGQTTLRHSNSRT